MKVKMNSLDALNFIQSVPAAHVHSLEYDCETGNFIVGMDIPASVHVAYTACGCDDPACGHYSLFVFFEQTEVPEPEHAGEVFASAWTDEEMADLISRFSYATKIVAI